MNEKILKIAKSVHSEVCGCDDKGCDTVNEIYYWLLNGDNVDNYTMANVPEFVAEWNEYNGQ